jgi:hypothetical protein
MKSFILFLLLFVSGSVFSQAPYYDSLSSSLNKVMCLPYLGEMSTIATIVIQDASSDYISYKPQYTHTSNPAVLDTVTPGFFVSEVSNNPGVLKLQISGTPVGYGDFSLRLVFTTPSGDSVGIVLPSISVRLKPVITVDPYPVVCSGDGVVDLYKFVEPDGGNFIVDMVAYPHIVRADTMNSTFFEYDYNDGYCDDSYYFGITKYTSPTVTLNTTSTSCGVATGSVVAAITQGDAPIASQSCSNGIINQTTINSLAAGEYSYTCVDTNQCKVVTNFSITPTGTALNETVTNVTCNGGNNGSISVIPVGLTAPVSFIWSSGHSTSTVSNLVAGTYTVYAKDAAGCEVSKVITVSQPSKLSGNLNTLTYPTCGGSNGQLEIANMSGGVLPYTYLWSNSMTANSISNLNAGVYSVTVTDANGCIMSKSFGLSEDMAPMIDTKTVIPETCGMSNGSILVNFFTFGNDTITSINWSTGSTNKDLTNAAAGNYTCIATTQNNCKAVFYWNIPKSKPLQQDICMVTVDSLTSTNLVVWEKAQLVGIDYYNIYRETSNPGEYLLIDTVRAQNISIFNDVIASPDERSWSYRIGAVNFCGVEAPLSFPHRTIHLRTVDLGTSVQVNWNAYQGTSTTSYDIWRYSDANGWELANTVPSSTLTYIDPISFSTPGLDYLIEFTPVNPCHAEKAQDFNTTRSNRERNHFSTGNGTGNSNNGLGESSLTDIVVYPNPTTSVLNVKQTEAQLLTYRVLSVTGQELIKKISSSIEVQFDMSQFEAGTYLLEISNQDASIIKRIINQ